MSDREALFPFLRRKEFVMGLLTITDEDGERRPRWYTHTINDNDRKGGGVGTLWKAGRWIITRRKGYSDVLRLEWHHSRKLKPELDLLLRFGQGSMRLHVGILGLASWWLTVGVKRGLFSSLMVEERVFGIRLGYIGDLAWIYLAFDEESDSAGMLDYYRRKKQAGESLYFGGNRVQLTQGVRLKVRLRLRDWSLGRKVYEKTELRREPVAIPLDGREYEGVWTLTRETWKRPRWPFLSHERVGSWIDVEHPPAFSGKGENSWDCGDDAIFGCGSKALTPAVAVGDYIKAVLRNRERYGAPSNPDAFLAA